MQDNRDHGRRKIIGRAEVLSEDEVLLVASMFNLSNTGMLIGTPEKFLFPEEFEVRQVGSGIRQAARLVWQKPGLAGILLL